MELEKYIKELKSCPNIEITKENYYSNIFTAKFGIDDNFPILMNVDYDVVIRDLVKSVDSDEFFHGRYKCFQDASDNEFRNKLFNYIPGWVVIQVQNEVNETCCTWDEPYFMNSKKQQRNYNMAFWIHPYQKRTEGIGACNAMADVIIDIGRYAMKKKLPLCIPCSIGSLHKGDFSRVVYFNP